MTDRNHYISRTHTITTARWTGYPEDLAALAQALGAEREDFKISVVEDDRNRKSLIISRGSIKAELAPPGALVVRDDRTGKMKFMSQEQVDDSYLPLDPPTVSKDGDDPAATPTDTHGEGQ